MTGAGWPHPFDLLPFLLEGLRVTCRLTVGAALLGTACAVVAGFGKMSRVRAWRWLCAAYVETFRGTSALIQLFWIYFALPRLGIQMTALTAGIVALGLNAGAYGAEVVRGALVAVPKGQLEAARALSFSERQIRWRIVFPQAVPLMLPPAGNLLIELLKNTALVSLITLSELTFQAQILRAATLRTAEIFGVVLVLYFLLARILAFGVGRLERAMAVGQGR